MANTPSNIPEKTIERLSEYRRTLRASHEQGITHIFSHVLAGIHGITAVQVRRDLMLIGFSSDTKKGYDVEVLDYLEGDVAGIKGVTFEVKGENAYGYLRSEKGVHRLVRISPFNAAGKRQTSFASCDVIPDIEEDIDIEINDDDLKIDTYRSSGAGGQHINKTSSAVRITHLPTGIVVQCQNERSQHMNKDKAMQMLRSKLYLMKQQEQAEKMSDIRGEVRDINFGNQIRSYVMQPYTLVKDHRTNAEVSNVGGVMDGNIDPFINAYLSANTQQAPEQ